MIDRGKKWAEICKKIYNQLIRSFWSKWRTKEHVGGFEDFFWHCLKWSLHRWVTYGTTKSAVGSWDPVLCGWDQIWIFNHFIIFFLITKIGKPGKILWEIVIYFGKPHHRDCIERPCFHRDFVPQGIFFFFRWLYRNFGRWMLLKNRLGRIVLQTAFGNTPSIPRFPRQYAECFSAVFALSLLFATASIARQFSKPFLSRRRPIPISKRFVIFFFSPQCAESVRNLDKSRSLCTSKNVCTHKSDVEKNK